MHDEILNFWFVETSPRMWWKADSTFDAEIATRFGAVHSAAVLGELFEWRASPAGRLAEIIVLDQFSRNLFRIGSTIPRCQVTYVVVMGRRGNSSSIWR